MTWLTHWPRAPFWCASSRVSTGDMTHGWICGTCCDSFICFGLGDMTHGWICGTHVWHDSFICVTWLIHMCDVSEIPWLIHTCNVSQIRMSHVTYAKTSTCTEFVRVNMWHDSWMDMWDIPWLIHLCPTYLWVMSPVPKQQSVYSSHAQMNYIVSLDG